MLHKAWRGVWAGLGGALRACTTGAGVRVRPGRLGLMALGFAAAGVGAQPEWALRATTGPSPRTAPAMAYDAARGEVVLFGGRDDGVYDGETWVWDGAVWTLRATTGPSRRYDHAMAYDAAGGELVLFGGWGGSTLGDTWVWDGSVWALRATTGPSPRTAHAMAYDAARGEIVLFGGSDNSSSELGDTWVWDGSAWTLRDITGPSPRLDHAMTYDAARGEVVLFGGWDGIRDGETWVWAEPCTADFNNDGVVNTQDFIAFLNAWATGDPLADWNDDGTIDTRDFIAYLGAWSAGC